MDTASEPRPPVSTRLTALHYRTEQEMQGCSLANDGYGDQIYSPLQQIRSGPSDLRHRRRVTGQLQKWIIRKTDVGGVSGIYAFLW